VAVIVQSIARLSEEERQAIQVFVHRLHESFPGEILQATLFGSKARGDSGPWSDIDILVIVREESWPLRGEISTLAARVSLEYDVLIGPRVIGLERWEGMERDGFSLYRNITAERVPLTPTPASS
jgi:predicted nucleotidyltransferase